MNRRINVIVPPDKIEGSFFCHLYDKTGAEGSIRSASVSKTGGLMQMSLSGTDQQVGEAIDYFKSCGLDVTDIDSFILDV